MCTSHWWSSLLVKCLAVMLFCNSWTIFTLTGHGNISLKLSIYEYDINGYGVYRYAYFFISIECLEHGLNDTSYNNSHSLYAFNALFHMFSDMQYSSFGVHLSFIKMLKVEMLWIAANMFLILCGLLFQKRQSVSKNPTQFTHTKWSLDKEIVVLCVF